jgi:hypothetical protein
VASVIDETHEGNCECQTETMLVYSLIYLYISRHHLTCGVSSNELSVRCGPIDQIISLSKVKAVARSCG